LDELKNIRYLALLGLLLITVGCSSVQASAVQKDRPPPTGIFATYEFRGSLKALKNWQRVTAVGSEQMAQFSSPQNDSGIRAAAQWRQLLEAERDAPVKQQLIAVNRFFNRWPYRLDSDVWQRNDYWATPLEFLRQSGDCEDYAICKYYALRYMGFDGDRMRIVVVKDTIRSITHAVLAVYIQDDILVLDNMSDPVFSHHRYQHYVPQYSVNEHTRWIHIKPATAGLATPTTTGE
jgi:predicted transglutaminase-like cysteine proteinase